MNPDVEAVLAHYPRIYFACHRRHVRDPHTGQEISAHQASVLDHLDTIHGTPLFDLARHMGVTASTMSLTVDRLARDGYVTRERSSGDARRLELRLTPAGAAMKEQKTVLDPELVERLLALLNEPKRKQALRGLEVLARGCDELIASGALRRAPRKGAA